MKCSAVSSAFGRESNAETISAILNDEPDWQLVPESIWPILKKCLAKEADRRYESASALREDLCEVREHGKFHERTSAIMGPTGGSTQTQNEPTLPNTAPLLLAEWRRFVRRLANAAENYRGSRPRPVAGTEFNLACSGRCYRAVHRDSCVMDLAEDFVRLDRSQFRCAAVCAPCVVEEWCSYQRDRVSNVTQWQDDCLLVFPKGRP